MTVAPRNPNDDMEELPGEAPGKSRKGLLLTGIALLVLLAAAAFLAGRLINSRSAGGLFEGGAVAMGDGAVAIELKMNGAKELPQTPPEVTGVFDHREDNSIFVGTGNMGIVVDGKEGGKPAASYDGPVVEVVVTGETEVFQDVTFTGELPEPGQEIQQKVAPGSIEDIGESSMVMVWGRKSGDRVIAEVLMFSAPMVMARPGN